jgi:hypothetical protein
MTATMHEPFTAGPAREGIAARLLVPAFWGAVSIVAMWLAVLFDGIYGGNMILAPPSSRRRWPWRCSPSSGRSPSPSAPSPAGTEGPAEPAFGPGPRRPQIATLSDQPGYPVPGGTERLGR